MASGGVNGVALGAIVAGSAFMYAGIKGISVLKAIQNIVKGSSPTAGQQTAASTAAGGIYPTPTGAAPSSLTSLPAATSYTQAQLEALWQQAGGSAASAPNAACHGMQESSGNALVTSPNPDGGTNVGLWQLDTKGVGAGYTVAQLQDPLTNARITVMATRNGVDWSDWATPGC